MPDRVSVTSADFVRNIGAWQEQALKTPVAITFHGRERLILLAADKFTPESRAQSTTLQSAALAMDHVSEGHIGLSEDFTILSVNRAAEAYLGMVREDLIGRSWIAQFPALEGSMVMEQIRVAQASRTAVSFETDSLLFEHIRLAATVYPLMNGVGVLFANITGQDALRTAARRAETLFEALSLHEGVAIVRLDIRGRITEADGTLARWSNFEPGALANIRVVDLLAPAYRRSVTDEFDRMVITRKPRTVLADLMTKQLRQWPLRITFAPVVSGETLEIWTLMTPHVNPALHESDTNK